MAQVGVGLLPGSQLEAAKAAGLEVQVMPSLYVSTLDVNKTMKPFDDPKVVEALHFAVDCQALVDTGEFGLGEVAYQPFPAGYVGYNPELDGIYAYDPDKAASILKEAGYTKPIPLTISTSNPEGVPELLQAQLSKVGFEPTIETIPQAQFTQQVYINHEKALAVDFFAGRESPAQAFQVLFSDTGLMNPGREYDPAVKEAIEKVIATPLDDPAYAERLQEATKVAVTSMPNTFLYSRPRVVARAKAVSELPRDPRSGQAWSPEPMAGTYNECAQLSAIIVRANTNAENPNTRAVLFHLGKFIPTGVPDTYGFNGIEQSASTGDTVALVYSNGTPGLESVVKFRWNGAGVELIGNTPG